MTNYKIPDVGYIEAKKSINKIIEEIISLSTLSTPYKKGDEEIK